MTLLMSIANFFMSITNFFIENSHIKRKNEVILYSDKYKEQYIKLHLKEAYWTGDCRLALYM